MGSVIAIKAALIGLLFAGLTSIVAGLWGLSKGHKDEKVVWEAVVAKMQLNAAETARETEAKYRVIEQELNAKIQEAQNVLATERAKTVKISADLQRARTERDGLRDQISAYAAGSGEPSTDTLAACRDRAQALGALLDKALSVSEASSNDSEQCESSVRALLIAWPKGN